MCVDPVTAMVAGSAIIGGIGAVQQGQAQASVEKQDARNALAAGYANENQARDDARRQMATQLAALSARGVSLSSGTPLALQADSARNAELNDLNIRANAQNTAAGYRYKASQTLAAVPLTVAGQLLGGGTKLAELGKL